MRDHPVIENCERTGWPDGKEPEYPHCPVCEERECGDVFVGRDDEVLGCEACVTRQPSDDVMAFRKAGREYPVCPVCGAECEDAYVDRDGEILGCDECVTKRNAWDRCECFGQD